MPRRPAIVVGTDLTPISAHAVARAAAIAHEHGAALHVVHATSRLPRALVRRFLPDEAAGERCVREAVESVVADLRADGVTASAHLVPGSAATILRKTARDVDAALVVVGSRGRTLGGALIGSTAERVVEGKGAPVLLARQPRTLPYRAVTVAVDVDSDVRRAVDGATFAAGGAELSILHAYEGPFENKLMLHGADAGALRRYRDHSRGEAREAVESRIVEAGLDARLLRLVHGNRRPVLARAAKSGVLLVIDRSDSAARHGILGSVRCWVIEHTAGDVLLV